MNLLEISGTFFNLWSVWLSTKENIWTWPVGLVGIVLFGILFYQIQLYSDLLEQVYYFVTGFYGWWLWSKRLKGEYQEPRVRITNINLTWFLVSAGIVFSGTWGLGYTMSHAHIFWPTIFMMPAAYPYLDAFTTVLSFVGHMYVVFKKIECWWIWVVVNTIGVWLYFKKDVWFLSALFFIFLIMSFQGLRSWRKLQKTSAVSILPGS